MKTAHGPLNGTDLRLTTAATGCLHHWAIQWPITYNKLPTKTPTTTGPAKLQMNVSNMDIQQLKRHEERNILMMHSTFYFSYMGYISYSTLCLNVLQNKKKWWAITDSIYTMHQYNTKQKNWWGNVLNWPITICNQQVTYHDIGRDILSALVKLKINVYNTEMYVQFSVLVSTGVETNRQTNDDARNDCKKT